MTDHRIVRRAWKEYADVRRRLSKSGSADAAIDHFGDVDRSDVDAWNRATADAHGEYRAAQTMPFGSIAVVCVTNRPERIADIVANVMRQSSFPEKVAVVVNTDDYDRDEVEEHLATIRDAKIEVDHSTRPASRSLGFCLNVAMAATDARFIAKFDDDDHYGPNYLGDALRAHSYAGAGIVGKHTWYAHLEETDETILRFPGNEFTYTSTLAGATLVVDRQRAGGLWFRDISIGEDRAFIADCNRRGVSTFAADRFNFCVHRGPSNSWQMSREEFIEKSVVLGPGLDLDAIDR